MCSKIILSALFLLAFSSASWSQEASGGMWTLARASAQTVDFQLAPNSGSIKSSLTPSNPLSTAPEPSLTLTETEFTQLVKDAVDQAVSESVAVVRKEDETTLFWNRVGFGFGGVLLGVAATAVTIAVLHR